MSRLTDLREFLRERASGGLALAFSGGVDSTLLLAVLGRLRDEEPFPLVALTMRTPFLRPSEMSHVREVASGLGVELCEFSCDPLTLPQVRVNAPDRCYWCKLHIFRTFVEEVRRRGVGTLLDGTNADDHRTYRPGLAALAELGVVSPLAAIGVSKAEVRQMAAEMGLSCSTQPSTPCLATRFDYGTELTAELVGRTMAGEEVVRRLVPPTENVRLRVHGALARIEVGVASMPTMVEHRQELAAQLRELGFDYVTLGLEGFRSGSMDLHVAQLGNGS